MNPCPLRHLARSSLLALAVMGSSSLSVAKPEPTEDDAWVSAPQKHNGSGLRLQHKVPKAIAAGQGSVVALKIGHVRAAQGALVRAQLLGSSQALMTQSLAQGDGTTLEVQLPPLTDGRHYLQVTTEQAGRQSVQLIPLPVGSNRAKLSPNGEAKVIQAPSGERLISLPATER